MPFIDESQVVDAPAQSDAMSGAGGFISPDRVVDDSNLETARNYGSAFLKGSADLLGTIQDTLTGKLASQPIIDALTKPSNIGPVANGDQYASNLAAALGYDQVYAPTADKLNALRVGTIGEVAPRSNTERYGTAIAEMAPSALIPETGGPLIKILSTIGAGIGREGFRDEGWSPALGTVVGGGIPALVSGASGKLASALGLGSSETRAAKAVEAAIGPETAAKIAAIDPATAIPNARTAETLRDPRLAQITAALESSGPSIQTIGLGAKSAANIGAEMDSARALAQRQAVAAVTPAVREPVAAGKIIRDATEQGLENATKVVGAAYDKAYAVKKPIKVDIGDAQLLNRLESNVASPEGQKAISNLKFAVNELDGKVPTEYFHKIRQQIDAERNLYKASTSPADKMVYRDLSTLRGKLSEASLQNPYLAKADALMRGKGTTFATQATEKILAKDPFKNYDLLGSKIVGKVLETPESIDQTIDAITRKSLAGNVPSDSLRAKEAISAAFVDNLITRSTSATTGDFQANAFARQWSAALKSGKVRRVLSSEQIRAVANVKADVLSKTNYLKMTRFGAASGSQTAEKTLTAQALKDTIMGAVKAAVGPAGQVVDAVMKSRVKAAEAIANDTLIRIAMDPKYAKAWSTRSATKAQWGEMQTLLATAVARGLDASKPIEKQEAPIMTPEAPAAAVPEKLVEAMVARESNDKPDAVSPKGAQGLMQIMPDTAKDIAAQLGLSSYDLKDKETNKKMGTHYMATQLKRFGSPELALAAYNAGPGKVEQWIKEYGNSWEAIKNGIAADIKSGAKNPKYYTETLDYVPWIMDKYKALSA